MATQWTAGLSDNTPLYAATLNQIGAVSETWTPSVTQGTTTFGVTVNYARYFRLQKFVVAFFGVTIASGTGQAATSVAITTPITLSAIGSQVNGTAWIYDASAATPYLAGPFPASTSAMYLLGDWSGGSSWGSSPNIQMTTSDQIRGFMIYEAA
jgi:hypothetical protein